MKQQENSYLLLTNHFFPACQMPSKISLFLPNLTCRKYCGGFSFKYQLLLPSIANRNFASAEQN